MSWSEKIAYLKKTSSWLEDLGFTENPFYLDPVPPDDDSINKGFIDRKDEQQIIQSIAELKKYRLLVLGRTGEGKQYKAQRRNG